ncbi:MAG TPA: tetratricopeptide repeat protein [Terriglobia bacterium]|nr:tetratricopeptide repeat protein [Terriglobia bacterium]
MFTSRNIHFAILGIILGAAVGYVVAFYQAAAAAPAADPHSTAASETQGALPANHPDVNSQQMLDLLKKAAEDSPNQPEVLSRYANELFQIGRVAESAEWYAKVVALQPKDTDVRSLYGAVLWKIGKKEEAKTQLQTALTQDPKHAPSMYGLSIIALDSHDVAKAGEYIQRIEKIDPKYPGLLELKAKLAAAK